jgi:hypothetical protein
MVATILLQLSQSATSMLKAKHSQAFNTKSSYLVQVLPTTTKKYSMQFVTVTLLKQQLLVK